ncbi:MULTISPECIES: hypothetical protein [Sphingobacterium]|uniref:hypothetical protein n=1 Tax=Sphingobacterium TaxID=28453 RepID=UPI00257D2EEB|nr:MULTISPECIES: hypothetical protein [Sphingobacterium]
MQFKTPLRPLLFVCAIGLLFSSCQKDGPSEQKDLIDIETRDAAWTKLSIPGQLRGTSAIYGNIDDTLVVATMYKIYMTTDKGASWQMVNDAGLGIPSFSMYQGELMALSNFQDHSTSPFLFSLDHGKSWSTKGKYGYEVYDKVRVNRKETKISETESYKISPQPNEIIDKEYGRPLMQPDKLVRVTDKGEQKLDFPFRRQLNYIYHDKKNRLYIGAEGTRFEWAVKGNERTYPTSTDTAIIYISKLPISAK